MNYVLDASALLALLLDEPGAALVERALKSEAALSAVNLAEVIGKAQRSGIDPETARQAIGALPVTVVSFSEPMAVEAGALEERGRRVGLSLGDRACLATAMALNATALTADRQWLDLRLSVEVEAIR